MEIYHIMLTVLSVLHLTVTFTETATLHFSSETQEFKMRKPSIQSFHEDTNIYLFVADGKKRPYSFVDDMGELVGFDVDIVNKVCALVGKRCHTVLAEFQECVFSSQGNDYAGRGLMAEWFDGCPGYQITTDRENEFDFTLPYLDSSASFTVAPGNPSKFNPDIEDYSRFTLLHLSGAPTNEQCLKRLHKTFGKILVADDLPEAKALLLNGTADVLFSPRTKIDGLEVLPKRVRCDNGGAGIMLKRGSTIRTWWNPAFQTFYFSGAYTTLCTEAARKYNAPVNCLPSPEMASHELLSILKAPQSAEVPEKIWKFVVSGRIEPYSYLDDEGKLIGFTKDMLDTVCERAGKTCILLLAQVPECSVRKGELLYPGRGLMEGWFDACTGYFNTLDRRNSWDFTSPYLVSNASFFVAPGNPSGFDPDSDDYSSYTLVYQITAISNEHCLNRLHKKFGRLIVTETEPEAIEMVANGTADAWFTKELTGKPLERLPQRFHCENVGTSIMARKGSELPLWWNAAFDEFYTTGEFNRFCDSRGRYYNYNFPCLPEPKKSVKNVEIFEGY